MSIFQAMTFQNFYLIRHLFDCFQVHSALVWYSFVFHFKPQLVVTELQSWTNLYLFHIALPIIWFESRTFFHFFEHRFAHCSILIVFVQAHPASRLIVQSLELDLRFVRLSDQVPIEALILSCLAPTQALLTSFDFVVQGI